MKKTMAFLLLLQTAFLLSCTTNAEDENDDFDAAKVCPLSGRGTFTDDRDGQVYKFTTIGNQVWMAENLRYDAEYSVCLDEYKTDAYDLIEDFHNGFGCFYSLQKNGSFANAVDDSLVKNICPKGWHLPSIEEWKKMIKEIGDFEGKEKTANRLKKDTVFWHSGIGLNTNDCFFSALPMGMYVGRFAGKYEGITFFYHNAVFLSSSVDSLGQIETIKIAVEVNVFNNYPKLPIRCVKD